MHYNIVQFRMLIFILTYVWCIINVSCNNDTLKSEINNLIAGSTNLNTSNNSVASGEVKSNTTKPVFYEGGSSVTTEKNYYSSTSKTSIQNETLNEKILPFDVQYGLNDSNYSTDRKKPHIGRKGVDAMKETSSEETRDEHSVDETAKTIDSGEKSSVMSTLTSTTISPANNFSINSTITNGSTATSISPQEILNQNRSSSAISSNSTASSGSRNRNQNSTTETRLNATELTQPLKPKPEFTRDDSDVDDNSSYSLTNPESDYVIPVVATIFAAPLLIVLAMFLYKRSKEFWERRHYRRMDFLIDGMYND